ncbi:hypothetical protein LTS18_011152, partial [Coniosporium uncinatum]
KVLSVAVETDYEWEGIEDLKDRIKNPDKYASAVQSSGPAETTQEEAAPQEEEKKEEEEEEDEDMGFGLFD